MRSEILEENRSLNRREMSEKRTVLKSMPGELGVVLTTRCNIRCIMCPDAGRAWELPDNIISQVTGLYPYLECIYWRGGEVFLYKRFPELFRESLRHPHMRTTIDTNGLFFSPETAEEYVRRGVTVVVSIPGFTRDTYEKINKGASFDSLLNSLSVLKAEKEKKNRRIKEPGYTVRTLINFVAMRSNFRETSGAVDFAARYGFDSVRILPVMNHTVPENERIFSLPRRPEWEELESMLPEIRERGREAGVEIMSWLPSDNYNDPDALNAAMSNSPRHSDTDILCDSPWKRMYIDVGGLVRARPFCREPVGDINTQSLMEVWNGDKMRGFRRKMLGRGISELCYSFWVSSPELRSSMGLCW